VGYTPHGLTWDASAGGFGTDDHDTWFVDVEGDVTDGEAPPAARAVVFVHGDTLEVGGYGTP
jgi:hypothetical protein